jgi:hypothetical protein
LAFLAANSVCVKAGNSTVIVFDFEDFNDCRDYTKAQNHYCAP